MFELRTGLDLCAVSRMEEACAHERFLLRIFTDEERAYADRRGALRFATLAGMWAAKEALCKALGTGIAFPMTDVEIVHGENGDPAYRLRGEPAKRCENAALSLSVTHEADMAAAVCVIIRM